MVTSAINGTMYLPVILAALVVCSDVRTGREGHIIWNLYNSMAYVVMFLIVEPSPLSIRILLGPKYSPQDPIFK